MKQLFGMCVRCIDKLIVDKSLDDNLLTQANESVVFTE